MAQNKQYKIPNLIPYRRDDKWGYCDSILKVKIPIIYDEALPFNAGMAAVRKGNYWGFIKKNGDQIIECKYHTVSDFFENGNAIVVSNDLKTRLIINRKGEIIRSEECRFSWWNRMKLTRSELLFGREIEDELELLRSKSDYKTYYLYVDSEGKKNVSHSKSGYYNNTGKFIEAKYKADMNILESRLPWESDINSEPFIPVKINSLWNFIDNSHQLLFREKIKYSDFLNESLINNIVQENITKKKSFDKLDDFWRDLLDEPETTLEQDGFDDVRNFSEGLAAVNIRGKWGFINLKGELKIKCRYDNTSDAECYIFKKGITKVLSGSKYFYIDNNGKEYFELTGDVLTRQSVYTDSAEMLPNEYNKLFLNVMEKINLGKKDELKILLKEIIKKNKIVFNYDINSTKILELLKKQVHSLNNIFQKYDVREDAWRNLIFCVVQFLEKKDFDFYDLAYTECHSSKNKIFIGNLEKDFILEILTHKMNNDYQRNRLSDLFQLCILLEKRKEVKIKIKGSKNYEMELNKFSLNNSLNTIKQLFASINVKGIKSYNKSKFENDPYYLSKTARLLIQQPKFFIQFISLNYPFNSKELNQWQEYLDWQLVSQNDKINFSLNLINRISHRWFWAKLASNKSIIWNKEMIDSLSQFLHRPNHILGNPMSAISRSKNIKWNTSLIESFKEKWEWKYLSSNFNLPWTEKLIRKFSSLWDWENLCVKGKFWSTDLISLLEDELDKNEGNWNYLLSNRNIKWSLKLVDKYKDKWFQKLPFRMYQEYDIYDNDNLPWCEDFIEKFKDKFNWYKLSESKVLPWTENLIAKFSDHWVWEELGSNESIPWNEKLMVRFENQLFVKESYLGSIFTNPSVKWTEELIDKYVDQINWKDLSLNSAINWTSELIDKYYDKIDWRNLSSNNTILWTDELINKYSTKLDFHSLSDNESVEWSYDLIDKFRDKIQWYPFCRTNKNWDEEIINDFNHYFRWDILANNEHFPWDLSLIKRFHSQMLRESDIFKYRVFQGTAIQKNLEYYNFILELYPDFKLEYPFEDIAYIHLSKNEAERQFSEMSGLFNPVLNIYSINVLMFLLIQNELLPHFSSEKERTEMEEEFRWEMQRQEWKDNQMSKAELADFLGYDYDDPSELDNISEDNIWERTGH